MRAQVTIKYFPGNAAGPMSTGIFVAPCYNSCPVFAQSSRYIAGPSHAPWRDRRRKDAHPMMRSSGDARISRVASGVEQVTAFKIAG